MKPRNAVRRAKSEDLTEGAEEVTTRAGKENICRIAKQRSKKSKENIGGKCLRDDEGNLVTG